jgi:hypothetical protein
MDILAEQSNVKTICLFFDFANHRPLSDFSIGSKHRTVCRCHRPVAVGSSAAVGSASSTVSSRRMGERWWLRECRRTLLELRLAVPDACGHCRANLRSLSTVGAECPVQHRSSRSTDHVYVRRLERLWRLRLHDTFAKTNAGCFAERHVRRAVQRAIRAECRLCAWFVSATDSSADADTDANCKHKNASAADDETDGDDDGTNVASRVAVNRRDDEIIIVVVFFFFVGQRDENFLCGYVNGRQANAADRHKRNERFVPVVVVVVIVVSVDVGCADDGRGWRAIVGRRVRRPHRRTRLDFFLIIFLSAVDRCFLRDVYSLLLSQYIIVGVATLVCCVLLIIVVVVVVRRAKRASSSPASAFIVSQALTADDANYDSARFCKQTTTRSPPRTLGFCLSLSLSLTDNLLTTTTTTKKKHETNTFGVANVRITTYSGAQRRVGARIDERAAAIADLPGRADSARQFGSCGGIESHL